MILFYSKELDPKDEIQYFFHLGIEESHHAIHVMRLIKGDKIWITNGKGELWEAEIIKAHPKSCEIQLITVLRTPFRNYQVHLGIAPTKNIDRLEWFLEKATEIGIDSIHPYICQNSERRQINAERLEKVLISAMKQSGQSNLPILHELKPFQKFLDHERSGEKWIAHCRTHERLPIGEVIRLSESRVFHVLIGPEGDFTEEEIQMANSKGFIGIHLGNNRLRTETAALLTIARLSELEF